MIQITSFNGETMHDVKLKSLKQFFSGSKENYSKIEIKTNENFRVELRGFGEMKLEVQVNEEKDFVNEIKCNSVLFVPQFVGVCV